MILQRLLIICVVLLGVCVGATPAQRRPVRPQRGALAIARPTWTIQSEHYDEDGVSTINVRLEPVPLSLPTVRAPKALVQLSADFTTPAGREPVAPPFVGLTLYAHTSDCKAAVWSGLPSPTNATATALMVNVDGRPLPMTYQNSEPRGEGVWWYAQEEEAGCAESIGVFVKPQTLVKLVAARSVSFKAGTYAFTLTGNSLLALRAFAGRLPPAR